MINLLIICLSICVVGLGLAVFLLWIKCDNLKRRVSKLKNEYHTFYRNRYGGENHIASLHDQLADLGKEVESVKQSIKEPAPKADAASAGIPQGDMSGTAWIDSIYRGKSSTTDSHSHTLQGSGAEQGDMSYNFKLARDYTRLIGGHFERHHFEEKYAPIPFGVGNAKERFKNISVKPIFEKMSKGRYWGIQTNDDLLVVPVPNSTVKEGDMREGAFNQLFECDPPPGRTRYTVASLDRPAILRKRVSGGWQIKQPGRLELHEYS